MKTTTTRPVFVAIGLILLLSLAVQAQVPHTISYQGRVTSGGINVHGPGYFKFALVNALGNMTYWSNDGTSASGNEPASPVMLPVADGLFTVMLGDTSLPNMLAFISPFTFEGFSNAHLRVWFSLNGMVFDRLSPDQPLGSTAYAMMAARVAPGAVGASQLAVNSVTADKIASGTITSNKIDWNTMPPRKGYTENGSFLTGPIASGFNSIALGFGARAIGNYSVVGGGTNNQASGLGATVGGGQRNTAGDDNATVGGGVGNRAMAWEATVGGGWTNTASGIRSTVGGGYRNIAEGLYSTVGGGSLNTATGNYATVAGGEKNVANGDGAFVGGGLGNTALGRYATIPGGYTNSATTYSFAAGYRAKAIHTGCFVWSDMRYADFSSTRSNQFRVRAGGGAQFVTVEGNWDLGATEGDFRIGTDTHRLKIGVAQAGGGAGAVWMRPAGGIEQLNLWAPGGTRVFSSVAQTSGVQVAAGGGSWTSISDRNMKEAFQPVDPLEILEKVASLPITTWNYKTQDASIRHIGPMAQDFYAAFGVGETDTGIATIDADGVALAAIQGVNRKLEEEVAELKARIERLEALIAGMP